MRIIKWINQGSLNLCTFLCKNETSFLVNSAKNQLLFLLHALFCHPCIDVTGEGSTEELDSQVLQAFYNTWEELEAKERYPQNFHPCSCEGPRTRQQSLCLPPGMATEREVMMETVVFRALHRSCPLLLVLPSGDTGSKARLSLCHSPLPLTAVFPAPLLLLLLLCRLKNWNSSKPPFYSVF